MASFNINIESQPIDMYTIPTNIGINGYDSCDTINASLPIGIVEETNTTGIYYLLNSWNQIDPWKTLRIKNIDYSDTLGFYLKHNGSKLPEVGETEYTIDITGLSADEAIATFFIEMDLLSMISLEYINFEISIDDINDVNGGVRSSRIVLNYNECDIVVPTKPVKVTPVTDNSCKLEVDVNVIVPAEGSRYVTIVADSVYGSPTISETITESKTYRLTIDAANTGVLTVVSTVLLRVFDSVSSSTSIGSAIIIREHSTTIC